MNEILAGIIIAVLGGALTATAGFVVAFSSRLARVEERLKIIDEKLTKPTVCQFHSEVTNNLARQDERVKALEQG